MLSVWFQFQYLDNYSSYYTIQLRHIRNFLAGALPHSQLDHRHLEVTVSFSHWAVTCNPCVWKVNLFHILEAEDWTTEVLGADFLYPFIFGRCWWGSCCLGENMLKVRGNTNKLRDKINAIAHCHSWNNPAQQHASPAWPFLVTW